MMSMSRSLGVLAAVSYRLLLSSSDAKMFSRDSRHPSVTGPDPCMFSLSLTLYMSLQIHKSMLQRAEIGYYDHIWCSVPEQEAHVFVCLSLSTVIHVLHVADSTYHRQLVRVVRNMLDSLIYLQSALHLCFC